MRLVFQLCALLLCIWALPAHGGRSCEERRLSPAALHQAALLGVKVMRRVEAAGAEAVIIGRIGSDLSEYGLKYSHAGLLLRGHPKGAYLFIHVLNHCGRSDSALYNEGLLNFFSDDPFKLEALVIIPSKALQRALLEQVRNKRADALHEKHYSMLAHPFARRYQNSNGWLLELIAAAQSPRPLHTRAQAQTFLRQRGYTPDRVKLPLFTRIGAELFSVNTAFDDHPREAEATGVYEVVTVRSILRYLLTVEQAAWFELKG